MDVAEQLEEQLIYLEVARHLSVMLHNPKLPFRFRRWDFERHMRNYDDLTKWLNTQPLQGVDPTYIPKARSEIPFY